jgi:hypothetical protein
MVHLHRHASCEPKAYDRGSLASFLRAGHASYQFECPSTQLRPPAGVNATTGASWQCCEWGQPNIPNLVFRTPSNRGSPIPVYAVEWDPNWLGQSTKREEDGGSDEEESDNPWYSVEKMQHHPPSGGPGASPPAL